MHYSSRPIKDYNLYFFKDKGLLAIINEHLKDEILINWALKQKKGEYVNFPKIYFFITFLIESHGSSYRKVTKHDYVGVTTNFLKVSTTVDLGMFSRGWELDQNPAR